MEIVFLSLKKNNDHRFHISILFIYWYNSTFLSTWPNFQQRWRVNIQGLESRCALQTQRGQFSEELRGQVVISFCLCQTMNRWPVGGLFLLNDPYSLVHRAAKPLFGSGSVHQIYIKKKVKWEFGVLFVQFFQVLWEVFDIYVPKARRWRTQWIFVLKHWAILFEQFMSAISYFLGTTFEASPLEPITMTGQTKSPIVIVCWNPAEPYNATRCRFWFYNKISKPYTENKVIDIVQ